MILKKTFSALQFLLGIRSLKEGAGAKPFAISSTGEEG